MPALMSAHHKTRIHHLGMSAVYRIAADEGCDPSDVIALLDTTSRITVSGSHSPFTRLESATQSQPAEPSHASAAQTDEEVVSSLASSSVDLSGLAAHERGPTEPQPPVAPDQCVEANAAVQTGLAPELVDASPAGSEAAAIPATPRKNGRPSLRDRVVAVYDAHPDWNNGRVAAEVGCSHSTVSVWLAPLRRKAQEAIAEALKAAPAKPQGGVEPADEPQAQAKPQQPPALMAAPQSNLPEAAQTRPRGAPQGRFYLREKSEVGTAIRYVHQALTACPTGPGPLMTTDRRWAWYDTMDRYRGAAKKWPELAEMRKVAANA